MRTIITIGDKDMELVANAASPYLYKQIFHEDFLREIQKPDPDVDIIQKMGYVMNMQAALSTAEILKLNEATYIEWLLQFEPLDIINAGEDIMKTYYGQTKGTSVPKRKGV